jgi:hypothetical protein
MDAAGPYLTAILPTILVATLFYFLIKAIVEGDRRERLAQKRFEKEEDERRAASATPSPSTDEGLGRPGKPSGNSPSDS